MKKIGLLFFVLLHFLSCKKQEPKIKLAVTSSLLPVFKEIVVEYKAENSLEIDIIHSSSGKLSSQLVHGAPYDIFFSADDVYCQFVKQQLQLPQKSRPLAKGNLVMVSNKKALQTKEWYKADRIGIANPVLAPYGKLSEDYLKTLSFYNAIKGHLIYGQNVNQVLQYLQTENVEVAFLSKANFVAANFNTQTFEITEIDVAGLQEIIHTSLVIRSSTEVDKFLTFLDSHLARKVLSKYGYVPL